METDVDIAQLVGGANQARVRAHNERLVLNLVRRHGTLSKAEIARHSGLSAQTVTIIMRVLEKDGLLLRGTPKRGRVGQPPIPMSLNPDGAFSLGVKIGRRSVDLILMDFMGRIRGRLRDTHTYPMPGKIESFVTGGVATLLGDLTADQRDRVAGLGIAMPFELWNWVDTLGADPAAMNEWRHYDVVQAFSARTGLPVYVQNDGTAACGAEFLFGRGRETTNYAYFFIGSFVGGGLVMDSRLVSGPGGNAGSFGTIRVAGPDGRRASLLDCASLAVLERATVASGRNPSVLWDNPEDWTSLGPLLKEWQERTAGYLSEAILNVCSVIDFETVIIDGNLPEPVRDALVRATGKALAREDLQGIRPFDLRPGSLGQDAQVTGGGSLPILARYLIDTTVLFKEPAPG